VNVYHITYGPAAKTVQLHFWGCNLSCRACLLKREIYDCHLKETKDRLFRREPRTDLKPPSFLDLETVLGLLGRLDIRQAIFMGAEPALDPEMPALAAELHHRFSAHNVLLTNGFHIPDLKDVDEVVFSIKAIDDRLHRDYTGKPNRQALENFIELNRRGVKLRTESIFIPEYIGPAEIEDIAEFIAGVDKTIPYRIDAYIPTGDNLWRRPAPGEIQQAAALARKHLDNVSYLAGTEPLKYEVARVF
jgi:pyruvate formate lyase activating enzyme